MVSCHVEWVLDDRVWEPLSALLRARPGGFRITPLLRAPHAGEDRERWLERARAAAELGPIGHHTHFARPDHARPLTNEDVERLRSEAEWLREHGVAPAFFCGGGWYSDARVAEAAADYGYVDCTALAFHPRHLGPGRRHLRLDAPARLRLPSSRRLLELPTTHSIGMIARAVVAPRFPTSFVHVYFHDSDLLQPRRASALRVALRLLALRRGTGDLEAAARLYADAPEVAYESALVE